jgi:hypothetical protein
LGVVTFQLPLDFHPNISYIKTYWIGMGQRGFHNNMSHELMFQTSAQSN